MNNWTVRKRILCGFSAIILVFIVLGGFSLLRLAAVCKTTASVRDSALPGLLGAAEIESAVRQNAVLTYKRIGIENPQEMAQVDAQIQSNSEAISKVYERFEKRLTSTEERQLLETVKAARQEYVAARKEVLALSREGKAQQAKEAARSRWAT